MDAIEVLTKDHREVETMFRGYERASARPKRREAIDKVICELSGHAAVEEQLLYPAVRDIPGGDEMADEGLREHQQVKEILAELEDTTLPDDAVDARMKKLMESVRHHVQEEEQELFPKMRQHMTGESLEDLGRSLERAKKVAPSRPHPEAPNKPPANLIAGVAAAAVDKVREVIANALPSFGESNEEGGKKAGNAGRARRQARQVRQVRRSARAATVATKKAPRSGTGRKKAPARAPAPPKRRSATTGNARKGAKGRTTTAGRKPRRATTARAKKKSVARSSRKVVARKRVVRKGR
jgi:hemerythrin superfamily protein